MMRMKIKEKIEKDSLVKFDGRKVHKAKKCVVCQEYFYPNHPKQVVCRFNSRICKTTYDRIFAHLKNRGEIKCVSQEKKVSVNV